MKLIILTTNVFKGLFAITSLVLETMPLIETVEENILWPMNKTLSLLQINAITIIDLNNLTEKTQMHSLNVITISYSEIETINDKSLLGLIAVETLKLNYCKIQTISSKAFESIVDTIVLIDLQYNELKVISFETFNYFLSETRPITVLINENPWNCYELSEEFINMINSNVDIFQAALCDSMDDTTFGVTGSDTEASTKESTFTETSPLYSTTPSLSIKLNTEFKFTLANLFCLYYMNMM